MAVETGSPTDYSRVSDRDLKRVVGLRSLVATAFGGVVGSGWLLAPALAAKNAGPASLVAWGICTVVFLLVALTMAELAVLRPEPQGLARWPFQSSGRLAGTLVGWALLIAYSTAPPAEATATIEYLAYHIHTKRSWLTFWNAGHNHLTWPGVLLALVMMVCFTAINWYGVRRFTTFNDTITVIKFLVPALLIVALVLGRIIGHPHPPVLGAHGFAPYGYGNALAAIGSGGLVFTFTGFQAPLDHAGEAKPETAGRDIPLAVVTGLLASSLLYLGLQIVYLGTVQPAAYGGDWLTVITIGWLGWVVYADAIASPAGTALVFISSTGRLAYSLGGDESAMPKAFTKIDRDSGAPRLALLLSLVIGAIFLVLDQSWQKLVDVAGLDLLLAYMVSAISLTAFRRTERSERRLVPGMGWIAPAGFALGTLVVYWAGWRNLLTVLVATLAGVLFYAWDLWRRTTRRADARYGWWFVAYLLAMLAISALGYFNGHRVHYVPAPWDSVIAAGLGLVTYFWGVHDSIRHLRGAR